MVELLGPDDILDKLAYALTNPVKDGLIDRAHHWPGASSLFAHLSDRPIAARRLSRFFRRDREMPEWLILRVERPPAFTHLRAEEWRALLDDRIRAIEASVRDERLVDGRRILGRTGVLRQRPADRPHSHEPRRQLNPRVASANKWARIEALQRNKAFLAAYRAARDLWKAGVAAIFPAGTYWLRKFAGVTVDEQDLTSSAPASPA